MSALPAAVALPAPRAGRSVAAWLGGVILAIFVGAAVLGPILVPYGVHELSGEPLEGPSAAHLLGTNSVGQDLLSQLLAGTRVSLIVGALAGGGTLLIGTLVGIVAGWLGGRADAVLMRVVDFFLVVPRIPLLVVVAAYAGSSLLTVSLIIALTSWPPGARIVRSQVLSLRNRAHLRASVGFGAGTGYVVRRHVLPEVSLILAAGLVAAAERAIVLEAGLAFLGLGDITRESWGSILRDALDLSGLFFTDAWAWWLLPPVIALAVLLLGLTLVGVAIERRVNPRLARHAGGAR